MATKQEFLEKLRAALNGKVTAGQLTENLEYYDEYINMEIRKGRSEEEVLDSLGDPRLIARTIVQTGGGSGGQALDEEPLRDDRPLKERGLYPLMARVPLWVWLILAVLVVVLVLSAVFSVIAALLPVLLPILGVLFLVKVFRDWMN